MLQRVFRFTYDEALILYIRVIRSNLDFIIVGTAVVFFIILMRFLLAQFAKYFYEVSRGLDTLVAETGDEIELSPEMEPMERKLKAIKQTLSEREREVRLAEQRKNDVVLYLAHDIKTPLTSVIGYLSLLDEAPDMPPEQKAKYVNITLEKAYRLEKLVDEFFEITRYNFQTITLQKEKIDLHYMLVQMADEFQPLLSATKHIVLHVPEDLTVSGDPDKLARVFNNILKNAIAYSLNHSLIEIHASRGEAGVKIAFINEGSIPQEKLEAIFDKFYRLDSARSSAMGGAGLGLPIAKEIVNAHGGEISAASDSKKTAFIVELPA